MALCPLCGSASPSPLQAYYPHHINNAIHTQKSLVSNTNNSTQKTCRVTVAQGTAQVSTLSQEMDDSTNFKWIAQFYDIVNRDKYVSKPICLYYFSLIQIFPWEIGNIFQRKNSKTLKVKYNYSLSVSVAIYTHGECSQTEE